MQPLRYTFLGDGPSDRALMPIIDWLLRDHRWIQEAGFVEQAADLWSPTVAPVKTLEERIRTARELYPCDSLFVHRDAEREPLEVRWREIDAATPRSGGQWVPIVPVRMTEAWLLIDESAIRSAADNPAGTAPLDLPEVARLEQLPNPKEILHRSLLAASEKRGRRRESFKRSLARRVSIESPI